jgi:hypothetical protein
MKLIMEVADFLFLIILKVKELDCLYFKDALRLILDCQHLQYYFSFFISFYLFIYLGGIVLNAWYFESYNN